MKLYKNVKLNQVDKVIAKSYQPDSVFLHHTGYMYGMGASVESEVGIEKICRLKMRESAKGFVVLVPHVGDIIQYVDEIDDRTVRLLEQFSPGNTTFVLKCSNPKFAHVALDGTVAFRVPQNPVLCSFIDQIGSPIISTSINKSNFPAESDIKTIAKDYDSWFDFGFISYKGFQIADDQPSTIIKIDKDIECLREGSVPFWMIKGGYAQPMILFVCTGNVCRSPIAEYLLRERLKENNLSFRTASAGVLQDGMVISANSAALLLQEGIDATAHLSRKLTEEMINDSWLILTMEEQHKRFFHKNFPQYAYKVFGLLEFCGGEGDIDDPYRQEIEKYKIAYNIINDKINCLIDILKK
ncbi:MAG: Sua5/YciO/YrdC/YwlC family protein [Candidatus Cloacimonadales bacterium]